MELTPKQVEAIFSIEAAVSTGASGSEVQIATSRYSLDNIPSNDWFPWAYINQATLRGLETKGLIRIVKDFWRGAVVEITERGVEFVNAN